MNKVLIKNAKIVNEGVIFEGDVLIENDIIVEISESISAKSSDCVIVDEGNYLMPGAIDDQVHFREPGLTHKEILNQNQELLLRVGLPLYRATQHT
jgi:dihydroorotase